MGAARRACSNPISSHSSRKKTSRFLRIVVVEEKNRKWYGNMGTVGGSVHRNLYSRIWNGNRRMLRWAIRGVLFRLRCWVSFRKTFNKISVASGLTLQSLLFFFIILPIYPKNLITAFNEKIDHSSYCGKRNSGKEN